MSSNFSTIQDAPKAVEIAPQRAPVTREEARQAAEVLVQREVVAERLNGDERGFKRWASNNASYLRYRIGLKQAELDGTQASVQAADDWLAAQRTATAWRRDQNGSVVGPGGVVMTEKLARKLGYEG